MLENNKRDPTLSPIMRIADALHVPVGVLFVMAGDLPDLGNIDRWLMNELQSAAAVSLPEGASEKNVHV